MDQIVQVAGAVLVLIAFTAAQVERLDTRSLVYLTLNLVGSGVLAGLAWHERQWGFLLLESVWALVSAWGLVQLRRDRLRAAAAGVEGGRGA